MKNLLFSLALLSSLSVYGQWIELDPGVEVSYFSDVYALSTDVAIIVGADGTILKTTDGGETWEQKPSGTSNHLQRIRFITPDTGYIVGWNGTLLKTTNIGETWNTIDTGSTANFGNLSVVNENLIFIVYADYLFKSEDGGESWQSIYVDNLFTDYYLGGEIQFFSSQVGYISTNTGVTAKTEDGGMSWEDIQVGMPTYFINESLGFSCHGGLGKTTNGGISFEYCGGDAYLPKIFAINENHIWGILGRNLDGDGSTTGIVKYSSTDSVDYIQEIWLDNDTSIDMWAIHFANETTGYIVGASQSGAAIWKNSTGINEGLGVNEIETAKGIRVYPNPASTELNIDLSNSLSSNATISIFNVSGQQIYLKSFSQKNIKINTSQFQKGVYILHIKTEQQNYTEKIVIN